MSIIQSAVRLTDSLETQVAVVLYPPIIDSSLAFNIQCPQLKDGRQFEFAWPSSFSVIVGVNLGWKWKTSKAIPAVAELINSKPGIPTSTPCASLTLALSRIKILERYRENR